MDISFDEPTFRLAPERRDERNEALTLKVVGVSHPLRSGAKGACGKSGSATHRPTLQAGAQVGQLRLSAVRTRRNPVSRDATERRDGRKADLLKRFPGMSRP